MRVLVTSFAQDAHFNGSVPLAWALRTAGHEVRVASQPALTDSITRAGLTALPVGTDHDLGKVIGSVGDRIHRSHQAKDLLENRPERLDLEYLKGWNTIITATFHSRINNESMVGDLVDFARDWQPDLVIWEPFSFAGAIAARASGAAHARLLSFPDMFLTMLRAFEDKLRDVPAAQHDDPLREWLGWQLDRFGCEYDDTVVTGQWTIDQMPETVRVPTDQPIVPMRYIPYNGPSPAVVPDWLRKSAHQQPRVCLTLGLTVRKSDFPNAVSVEEVFEAVEDLDVEFVATLSPDERDLVSHIPDNTKVVDHVPLHALMPTCSAIVHHGGAGTWATAAAYGVPQVAMGWVWDAIYRAQRLEEAGAGLHVGSHDLTAAGLREKVLRLLEEPSFRHGADKLRQEMGAAPSPNEVVPQLEKMAAERPK